MTREPGQGRRDLRKFTKPGALGKSHKKKGCGKATLILMALPVAAVWLGWTLAAALWGGAA